MSLLQKISSILSRNKPEQIPNGTVQALKEPEKSTDQPVSNSQPASNDAEPPSGNVVNIYSHGFTNGVYRIDADPLAFERFLEFCNESDKLKEQRTLNKLAIIRVQEQLEEQRTAFTADSDIVVIKEKEAARMSTSIEELVGIRRIIEQKEAALVIQQRETVAEYAWVPAILFLSAGITFISADVSITKQITSWGFNMTGMQGLIYAIGLAFTAFLIKPAIDRMLEKPYQAGGLKLKPIYKSILIGITLLGLLMLWFLGRFRADSERAGMKLRDLTERMALMDPTSTDYAKLQTQYDSEQQALDDNKMGQNGLVLSGLLFAVGGAVCLTISFGSLKQLINRYWILPTRIARVRRKQRVLSKRLDGMRAEHTLTAAEQGKAQKRLAASELPELRAELDRLRTEELTLLTAFYQSQSERERALYRDGLSRGDKFQLDGELLYRVPGNDGATLQLGNNKAGSEIYNSPRNYTRRPFIKMRKMIADRFNKNKNNQPYDDGTEVEIVA